MTASSNSVMPKWVNTHGYHPKPIARAGGVRIMLTLHMGLKAQIHFR